MRILRVRFGRFQVEIRCGVWATPGEPFLQQRPADAAPALKDDVDLHRSALVGSVGSDTHDHAGHHRGDGAFGLRTVGLFEFGGVDAPEAGHLHPAVIPKFDRIAVDDAVDACVEFAGGATLVRTEPECADECGEPNNA